MCNLSEGVFERGVNRGMERQSVEIAKKLLTSGVSEEIIISSTGLSKEEVEKLKKEIEH